MIRTIIVGLFQTNCYLLPITKNEVIVIDAGAEGEKIAEILKSENLSLSAIFCTHGHLDHIGGISPLLKALGSPQDSIPIFAAKKDSAAFGENAHSYHQKSFGAMGLPAGYFESFYNPIPKITTPLEGGEFLSDYGIQVIATPGHTPGGLCFLHEKSNSLFVGDTLFSQGIGRTDLLGGDEEELKNSIIQILSKEDKNLTIFSGHGNSTSLGQAIDFARYFF